jgi:hypothetical protein
MVKQYNLGPHIGALKVQAVRAQSYYGLVQTFLVAVAAKSQLQAWFPWLSFQMIVVGLMFLYLAVMFIDHLFIIKAEYAHNSRQVWQHSSPCAEHFHIIEKHLGIEEKK